MHCFAILLMLLNLAFFPLQADSKKILSLKKTQQKIAVDGFIDATWSSADSVEDFIQQNPYHSKNPSRRTVVKILTTEQALYCLMICEDSRENIQSITGKVDDGNGDLVALYLDTFGDKRTAYQFMVTASGVRNDARMLDDARNQDSNWDGIWFASSKVYDWGYVVEMEIPYRSIQYDESLKEWGIDFERWLATLKEDNYWCPYEENEGQRISKFGKLVFESYYPSIKGMNLEVYPVGITKATLLSDGKYKGNADAGIDIFYNPSQKLTFQLTGNPDFAQIEADPYSFNISRYESYFSERRPFFTQGNEVFTPSGRDNSSGFYQPLELFYSRRIGKKLSDGSEVPLLVGTKAFGRFEDLEYGGFLAMTGEKEYSEDGENVLEPRAYFGSARLKKQILGNSSVGILFVGKRTADHSNAVLDVDGAFRGSDWQLSYQIARSFMDNKGDFGGSAGLMMFKEKLILGIRTKYIGNSFDINEVGFVPWKGTAEFTAFGGPRWYFADGYLRQVLLYTGASFNYERTDWYTDHAAVLGLNMQFRPNWGYELTLMGGKSKDLETKYDSYEVSLSSWFNVSSKWSGNTQLGYSKTYNFSREYLASYGRLTGYVSWHALNILDVGTSFGMFIENKPDNSIEEITYNARPFFSLTPVNDLNIRVYVDNLYLRSSRQMEQVVAGFLFSYSFLPKSWIYLAVNEIHDRSEEYDRAGLTLPNRLHVTDRASVFKIKYLYYL
ncbi:MAG: DUF5916 domain-containing protein [bacterium]